MKIIKLLLIGCILAHTAFAACDDFTVLMLHMNGSDASTSFPDASLTPHTMTANGHAQVDTAQFVFGGASGLFDGTGDYLSTADSDDWQLDGGNVTGEWTIDFRLRLAVTTGRQGIVMQRTDADNRWLLAYDAPNGGIRFFVRSGGVAIVNVLKAWSPSADTWYHVELGKDSSGNYYFFINGTQLGTTATDTTPIPSLTGGLDIGRDALDDGTFNYLNGWIDELRISKGIIRNSTNFTPPTSQYCPAGSTDKFFQVL